MKMNKFSSVMMCAACCAILGLGCGKDAGRHVGEIKEANIKAEDLKVVKVADGVEIAMVRVEPGSFTMNQGDGKNFANEVEHTKKLTKVFYIGQTEVTQKQYRAVVDMWKAKFPEKYAELYPEVWNSELGKDKFGEYIRPMNFFFSKDGKGKDRISEEANLDNYPVENISWVEAMDFCMMLNDLDLAPKGYKFTLPTETQWEFAARGGNAGKNNKYVYSGSNNIDNVAWYNETAAGRTGRVKEVGVSNADDKRSCNELGLYDMSGNVAEWCLDSWVRESDKTQAEFDIKNWSVDSLRYRKLIHKEIEQKLSFDNKRDIRDGLKLTAEEKDALDTFKCTWRSYRGGAWSGNATVCRISNRGAFSPYELHKDVKKNEKDKNAKNDLIYSVVGYPHIGIRLVLVPAE